MGRRLRGRTIRARTATEIRTDKEKRFGEQWLDGKTPPGQDDTGLERQRKFGRPRTTVGEQWLRWEDASRGRTITGSNGNGNSDDKANGSGNNGSDGKDAPGQATIGARTATEIRTTRTTVRGTAAPMGRRLPGRTIRARTGNGNSDDKDNGSGTMARMGRRPPARTARILTATEIRTIKITGRMKKIKKTTAI